MKTIAYHEVTIDTNEAKRILAEHSYSGQRPYSPSHAKFLAEEMERKRFEPTAHITIAVDCSTMKKYLVNGQHTLNAICLCGIPQRLSYQEFECNGYGEVSRLYTAIDVNKPRPFKEQVSAIGLADDLGFTPTQINHVSSACKLISWGFAQKSKSTRLHLDDVIRWVTDYAKYAHQYFDITFGMPGEISNGILRAATMSVGLLSYRFSSVAYGKDKVDEFWKGVAFGEMLTRDDPRNIARTHILSIGMHGGGVSSYTKRTNPAESCRYIAKCFNGFLEGKTMIRPKMPTASDLFVLRGSPFNERQQLSF